MNIRIRSPDSLKSEYLIYRAVGENPAAFY